MNSMRTGVFVLTQCLARGRCTINICWRTNQKFPPSRWRRRPRLTFPHFHTQCPSILSAAVNLEGAPTCIGTSLGPGPAPRRQSRPRPRPSETEQNLAPPLGGRADPGPAPQGRAEQIPDPPLGGRADSGPAPHRQSRPRALGPVVVNSFIDGEGGWGGKFQRGSRSQLATQLACMVSWRSRGRSQGDGWRGTL